MLALILMNVLRDHTAAHPTHNVLTHRAHTDVTAYPVGEIEVIILVLILTNVLREDTTAQPTHIVLTHKAHTAATATAVFTDLGAAVIVSTTLCSQVYCF